jgi:hypothetical protein
VLIEFERGRRIIVDRPLYRELVKTAIKRTHDDLQTKTEAAAKQKKTNGAGKAPADPVTVAKRERDAQLRELTDQAHTANTDFGHALVHNLSSVDPTDIDVARFFVLCGCRHRTNYADRLTMRISRCRTRGNGAEAGSGAAKARSGRVGGGEEDGFAARLDGPLPRGARLLTLADLGRRRSLRGGRDGARSAVRTLAIADEAAATPRRPGASAVRPQRASAKRRLRRPLVAQ